MSVEIRLQDLANSEDLTFEEGALGCLREILRRCAENPHQVPVQALSDVITACSKQKAGTEVDNTDWMQFLKD